jgi:cytosine/adenosine deaminase-related metal-dependent hydrolase
MSDAKMSKPLRRIVTLGAAVVCLAAAPLRAQEASEVAYIVKDGLIVPLDWSTRTPRLGYMVVGKNGRILAMGDGEPPPIAVPTLDLGGKIVMPGFLSGHSHLTGSVRRGRAAGEWVTEWRLTGRGRPDKVGDTYAATLHGALDMLIGGVTTVYNYASMGSEPESLNETLEAVLDAGGHYVFGTNIPSHHPTLSQDELIEVLRTFIQDLETARGAERILKLSMSSRAMRWTENESAFEFEVLKILPDFEMDMQMHYLEPPPNVPRTIYERSNFVWLKKYGILGPNLTFAHFVHPTDEMLMEAIAAGATMSWNPLSNARLASGLTDVPRFRELGLVVGMGIDGQGSADIADPFQNMRVGLYGLRFRDQDPNVMSPYEILHLHTIETAKAIRVDGDVGSLEVGKYADFLVVDPNDPASGPVYDVYATLVFSMSRANITDVYVAGEPVIKNHEFLDHDLRQFYKNLHYRLERD